MNQWPIKIAQYLEIDKHFNGIFGSLPNSYHKADVITRALNNSHANLEQSIIVGDTKFDIIGGKSVGIATLGVLWGFGNKKELTTMRQILSQIRPRKF